MSRYDRFTAACAGIGLCVLWFWACPGILGQRPDIVLIATDDQPASTLDAMPLALARIADQGVTLHGYYMPTPLCGPARATLLTGLYEHHHGVISNGGAETAFRSSAPFALPVWLHDAGYRTGFFLKYQNHYMDGTGSFPAVPPGWDYWLAYQGGYFGPKFSGQRERRTVSDECLQHVCSPRLRDQLHPHNARRTAVVSGIRSVCTARPEHAPARGRARL